MPEIGELQRELGSAITQLEVAKKLLLDVFEWSSRMGMIDKQELSQALMKIEIARTGLPVMDIALCRYLELFKVKSSQRLTLVPRSGE